MVEYAILFIVLSILFIGGAELGMAALASYKNTDAAKTGISEYVEVNQRRLNILNAEKQYLIDLSSYNCKKIRSENSDLNNDSDTADQYEVSGDCVPDTENSNYADNFIRFMDSINDLNDFDTISNSILSKHIDPSCPNYTGTGSESIWNNEDLDVDACEITESELNSALAVNEDEGQDKFKALLLISHIKLSKLPLESSQPLSQAKILIGNHASSNFSQPRCEANEYIYGFPDNDGDGIEDRFIIETQSGSEIYLFNPLPINVASCQGSDDTRGGRSRISILVGGYSDPTDPTKYEPGLPKLNQAMYGMYNQSRDGNLNPPGNICIHDDCPNENLIDGSIGPTGYYRWNKGSDGSGVDDLFKYTINNVEDELLNGFRPTMQLDCSPITNFKGEAVGVFGNINDPLCQNAHSKVRLHTRYRKVFEGFLTLGLQELNVSEDQLQDALKLFYNPNQVGVDGSTNIVGSVASEVGPIGRNRLPTIKPHKDFRGCYEVDVETNQVSACN